jgi:TonB-linked SusC/RagA family outer membrane protein
MIRRTFWWALCVLAFPFYVFAQQAEIHGVVRDASTDRPLPGANILIRGTTIGIASDNEGRYRMTIAAAEVRSQSVVVEARFVGFLTATQELVLTPGTHEINFTLNSDVIGLEEIVVTALGITREERSLGYAISRVDGEEITRSAQSSLANALRGSAPGLNIVSSSGQPGKASRVEIRGISSITGENQPLWVVDGVVVSTSEDPTAGYENALFTGGAASRQIDIDPNIIKDITVLKGASATALYGSRAAHGAIIITTKGALTEAVAPRVSYRSRVGWEKWHGEGFQTDYLQGLHNPTVGSSLFYHGDRIPAYQFLDPRHPSWSPTAATRTSGSWGPHKDSLDVIMVTYNGQQMSLRDAFKAHTGLPDVPIVDNRANFYQQPMTYENSINITGGVPGMNYFLSFSDLRQDGIVPSTNLERSSLNARFEGRLHPRLKIGTSIIYSRTWNQWQAEGNGARAILWQLNFAPINLDLRDYLMPDGLTQRNQIDTWNNPYWIVEHNRYTSDVDRVIGSVNFDYNLTPWLVVSERVSFDTYTDTRKEEFDVGTQGRPLGSMFDRTNKWKNINSDLNLSAQINLTPDIRMVGLVGHNVNVSEWKWERQRGLDLSVPGFFHIRNAASVIGDDYLEEKRLIGLYSSFTFDYRDYVYLTLTARNDWSSTLPKDDNSFFYPSASIGFVFTEAFADVFRNTPINFGRLRGAISQVGSDPNPYVLTTSFLATSVTDGVRGELLFPYRGLSGYSLSNAYGNPVIKPEITTEYEVGFDLRFFNGRARIDVAYYDRVSKDQIFNAPISTSTGYSSMIVNAGEIRNYGIEMSLGGTPIQTRDFSWDLRGNFTKNTTDVVKLTEGVENIGLAGFTTAQIRIMEGKGNYGIIWSYYYEKTDAGDMRIRNVNPDQLPADISDALRTNLLAQHGLPIEATDLGNIGSVMPDWMANVRSSIRFKGLEVSALLDIRQGGKVFNFDMYYQSFYGTHIATADRFTYYTYDGIVSEPILERNAQNQWVLVGWEDTNVKNSAEIYRNDNYYRNFFGNTMENFVEDASFIKLRELTVAYTLPTTWLNRLPISSATVSFTGVNLWIDSKFSYLDPEGNLLGSGNAQGFYHMVVPTTRGYNFSLGITL